MEVGEDEIALFVPGQAVFLVFRKVKLFFGEEILTFEAREKGRGEKILRRILKWLSSSPKEIQFKVEVTELFGFKEIQV